MSHEISRPRRNQKGAQTHARVRAHTRSTHACAHAHPLVSLSQRAVVMPNGDIKARPMMYIALSYDHRYERTRPMHITEWVGGPLAVHASSQRAQPTIKPSFCHAQTQTSCAMPRSSPPPGSIGMCTMAEKSSVFPDLTARLTDPIVGWTRVDPPCRLIDGREAVTFLKKIKEVIEDPRRVLIDA